MTDRAIVTTKGVADFKDELEGIADAIRRADPELEVEVLDPTRMAPGRYGVIWGEILHVTLPIAEGYAAGKIIDAVIAQARKGSADKQRGKPRPRPRSIVIFGPDGKIIKSVKVDMPSEETDGEESSAGDDS